MRAVQVSMGCMALPLRVSGTGLAGCTRTHRWTAHRVRALRTAQVVEAFKILTSDKQVKALLVNIFGGIMKCDVIASGIVNAARIVDVKVPLVVRLEGTNVQQGKEILRSSGIAVITADDLDDAAKKAVAAIGSAK